MHCLTKYGTRSCKISNGKLSLSLYISQNLFLLSKDRKLYVHDFKSPSPKFTLFHHIRPHLPSLTPCQRNPSLKTFQGLLHTKTFFCQVGVGAYLKHALVKILKKLFCQVSVLIALLEVITAKLLPVIEQHFSFQKQNNTPKLFFLIFLFHMFMFLHVFFYFC